MSRKSFVKWRVVPSLVDSGRRLNGDWIRHERKRRCLSLRELAREVKITHAHLSHIEIGSRIASKEVN